MATHPFGAQFATMRRPSAPTLFAISLATCGPQVEAPAPAQLAMALGVQHRRTAGGGFVHSAMVTLLDAGGHVAMQVDTAP